MMLQFGIPELPETISVETVLVGRGAARLQNLNALDLTNITTMYPTNHLQATFNTINYNQQQQTITAEALTPTQIPMTAPIMSAETLTPFTATTLKAYVNAEILTDGPNPMRDRALQTDLMKNISIGIQCNVEDDIEDAEFKIALAEYETNLENTDDVKKCFIEFVKKETKRYDNGKFECMLCGEIKPSPKLITSHVALHWGPPQQCSRCGIVFEHEIYWKTHNCNEKSRRKRRYIKCPHYACKVSAISPAELYDHLNEHCGLRPYRCSCKKRFPTVSELLLHRKLHKSCLKQKLNLAYKFPKENSLHHKRVLIMKTAKGKQVLVKCFLSQIVKRINIIRRYCCVCLKRCKNEFHFQQHTKRCLKEHKRRLKIKRDSYFKTSSTNITKIESNS